LLFEQALILAENENDAHCVGAERVVVIERLRDIHGKTDRVERPCARPPAPVIAGSSVRLLVARPNPNAASRLLATALS